MKKMSDILAFLQIAKPFLLEQTLAIQTAYKAAKIIEFCEKEGAFYDNQLNKILNSYAEKDEDGNFIQANGGIQALPQYREIAQKEVNELLAFEVEDKDLVKLSLDELPLQLTVNVFMAMQAFVE